MSPRRRTLCSVFIVVSLSVGSVLAKCTPSSGSIPPITNSLLTVPSPNRVLPEVVPPVQKLFPNPRLGFNDAFSSHPQGSLLNSVSTSNLIPNFLKSLPTSPIHLTPNEWSNPLIMDPITNVLGFPSDRESLPIIENYPFVPQTAQFEAFNQPPINVQTLSIPQLSPFISVASPFPEMFPTQNIMQEMYPQTVDTEITTVTTVPIETLNIPSSEFGCCGQQSPVALQFNMASPWTPEPLVTVVSQPQPAPNPCSSFDPSYPMTPGPLIVMEKSKSRWKSILPILMLSLFDGGCGNNGGCCCCSQCSANIPVPFPIVIPTNNPIISGGSRSSRGKGKSKAPDDTAPQN